MAYRRFRRSEDALGLATLATAATLEGRNAGTVASVATVARQNAERDAQAAQTVASVATVARPEPVSVDLEDWQAYFEERAAIREFDGGLPRHEAERLARGDVIALLGPEPLNESRSDSSRRMAGKTMRSGQNTSHAVMAQRVEAVDSRDDFPTPPWATRGLLECVLDDKAALASFTCLEPACGAGHMSKVLKEYFGDVRSGDAYDYGYAPVRDFLTNAYEPNGVDWVITNPPFRQAEKFVLGALRVARHGVAILGRTGFLESRGRYEAIFRDTPPSKIAVFVERVPMVKGRLDATASTATSYAWFIWEKNGTGRSPQFMWVPPCRTQLERKDDYTAPVLGSGAKPL